VIEREFEATEGAEPVGFSHGDFGLVVQTLDDATGERLLRLKIVEDQRAVLAQGTGDFLEGLDESGRIYPARFP
jgi:hypothetical protein